MGLRHFHSESDHEKWDSEWQERETTVEYALDDETGEIVVTTSGSYSNTREFVGWRDEPTRTERISRDKLPPKAAKKLAEMENPPPAWQPGQPCPKCGGRDFNLEIERKTTFAAGQLAPYEDKAQSKGWKCKTCGHSLG